MTKWRESIPIGDVLQDEGLPFETARDIIVARFRDSRWYQRSVVSDAVDLLELQDDEDGFNYELNDLYDMADRDLIWLDTFAVTHGPSRP